MVLCRRGDLEKIIFFLTISKSCKHVALAWGIDLFAFFNIDTENSINAPHHYFAFTIVTAVSCLLERSQFGTV